VTTPQHRVLVVDDEDGPRETLAEGLSLYCKKHDPPLDWKIEEASDRKSALRKIKEAKELGRNFAVVVTDLVMDNDEQSDEPNDEQSGVKLIRKVPDIDPLVLCILYTVQPGALAGTDTSNLGAFHEIAKESRSDQWMNQRIFERIKAAISFRAKMVNEATLRQFFTPRMADRLAQDPTLLDPRRREVTVLFCDVRKFSEHCKKLGDSGISRPFAWIRDVMATLTECVVTHHGEVIDFIGDELMAMWGAPDEQLDHAQRACQAALAMLNALPALQERWRDELGEQMEIGIGLDSGTVLVGNIGTTQRSKYGALGEAVNRASRIQGATKHLLTPLLLSRQTFSFLDGKHPSPSARKVCEIEVKLPDRPVVVYDLDSNERPKVLEVYPRALRAFESERYQEAADLLATLVGAEHEDGPSVVLLVRALQGLREGTAPKHPLFVLPSK
jgi:class 3 adenylate cyclase